MFPTFKTYMLKIDVTKKRDFKESNIKTLKLEMASILVTPEAM